MAVFVSLRKDKEKEEKNKKLSQSLKSHISGTLELKQFHSNWVCGVVKLAGMSTAKFVLFRKGSTELRRCENRIFFLLVNILMGVACWLLGRMTHYHVS